MRGILAKSGPFLAASTLLVVIGGCGSASGDSPSTSDESTSALVARPSAKRPISSEIAGFERALRSVVDVLPNTPLEPAET
jgi:hypothetical protein